MKEWENTPFSLKMCVFELHRPHYITQAKPQEDLFEDLQELWPATCELQGERPPGFSIKRSSMNHKAASWKHYTIFAPTYHSWLPLYRQACYEDAEDFTISEVKK